MKLLDYTEKTEVADASWGFHILGEETDAIKRAINNRDGSYCPFCNAQLETIVHLRTFDKENWTYPPTRYLWQFPGVVDEFLIDVYCVCCKECGWWRVKNIKNATGFINYSFPSLRLFEPSSKDLPLSVIWTELSNKPDLLNDLNSAVFEKFVGEVISSNLNLKVEHIGRSGDGGIDLFYSEGNERVAIQVKRRTKKDAKEGVSLVREFLGAILLSEYNSGVIVSTGASYTKGAVTASTVAHDKGYVSKLDLVDRKRFLEMFHFSSESHSHPWELVFNDVATNSLDEDEVEVIFNKSTLL